MKKIKLTRGQVALVDDEDFESLNKFKWHVRASKNTDNYYAVRHDKLKMISMARQIQKAPKGLVVDHINGVTLDNQRKNLRICTQSQNMMNRCKYKTNNSGFKGVSWGKASKKWRAQINVSGKKIHLGHFKNKEDAYQAYCGACIKYHGEYANRN